MTDQVVEIGVRVGGQDCTWLLDVARRGREWLLLLRGGERAWSAEGPDLFEAVCGLRAKLANEQILLGINGARPMSRCIPEAQALATSREDAQGRP